MPKKEWNIVFEALGYASEKAMLEDLYTKQGMSVNELSEHLGYSRNSIRLRLVDHRIKLRSRGGPNYKGKLHLASDVDLEDTKLAAVKFDVHLSAVHKERKRRGWISPQSAQQTTSINSSKEEENTSSSDSSASQIPTTSRPTSSSESEEISLSSIMGLTKDS